MQKKRCFFIGHRDAQDTIYPLVLDVVKDHITKYGVTRFIVGRYGAFDKLAAKAVMECKRDHPEVTLSLLLPYFPTERKPEGFDDTIYPEGLESVPNRYAIVEANRYMVNRSDYLIAYAWQPGSNAVRLLEYAKARNVQISNLCSGTV